MNIVCIGGGPAGLYFSLLMKKQNPDHRITVIERNRPYDTFGWGVVFSDQTLGNLANADEPTARAILQAFNHWDDIEIHFKGETVRSGGHGFCGIGRKRLLNILQARCEELGVQLVFETEVQDDQAIAHQYGADLVIASDGLNSRIRTRYAASYQPEVEQRHCRFVWLGTRKKFEAFTFAFRQTPHGWFQAHIYQYDGETSTFIVETPEHVWRAAGLDAMSQEQGIAFCEALFAEELDGHELLSNSPHLRGSAQWITFPRIVCRQWVHRHDGVPVVLMGDAAHTAHYSIGSGTKLALEDAIELARCFGQQGDTDAALAAYQQLRAIEVLKIQSAARNSMEWFENVERYSAMEAPQFAYSMLTRSQQVLFWFFCPMRSQGNCTLMRPSESVHRSWPSGPTTRAVCGPWLYGFAGTPSGRNGSLTGCSVSSVRTCQCCERWLPPSTRRWLSCPTSSTNRFASITRCSTFAASLGCPTRRNTQPGTIPRRLPLACIRTPAVRRASIRSDAICRPSACASFGSTASSAAPASGWA